MIDWELLEEHVVVIAVLTLLLLLFLLPLLFYGIALLIIMLFLHQRCSVSPFLLLCCPYANAQSV
jgi:hypothetical protein